MTAPPALSEALSRAKLYLVAPASLDAGPLVDHVDALAEAGVDLIQLREKEMEAGDLLRVGGPIAEACHVAGIPFIVNDRPDVALALGADGVHVGRNDLPIELARRFIADGLVGTSTHARGEIDDVLKRDADYFAVGPVYETPTKAGRPAAGIDLVRYAAESGTDVPWFAIGGLNEDTLPPVLDAGARRAVVVRAITESDDPGAAARRLREMVDAANR